MNSNEPLIKRTRDARHVVTLTLNRPQAYNALSEAMLSALQRELDARRADSALLVDRRETLDLLRAYHKVDDVKLRRQFIEFIREIARMRTPARH